MMVNWVLVKSEGLSIIQYPCREGHEFNDDNVGGGGHRTELSNQMIYPCYPPQGTFVRYGESVIEHLRSPFARIDWFERIGDVVAYTGDGEETNSEK